jgi:hypothetical protein
VLAELTRAQCEGLVNRENPHVGQDDLAPLVTKASYARLVAAALTMASWTGETSAIKGFSEQWPSRLPYSIYSMERRAEQPIVRVKAPELPMTFTKRFSV